MSARGKFVSLKNQLFVILGFIVLFLGLLFHFYSDTYPMLRSFNYLFIIADCIGALIIFLSLFLAYISHKNNLKESLKSLVIESSLTFAFNFSLQALIFHYLFHNSLVPVSFGIFFSFISYLLLFIPIPMSLTFSLFKKYYVLFFTAIVFVSVGTLISGVLLTFTGSIDPIIDEGIGALSLGVFSIFAIILTFAFYPKWKFLLAEDDEEEIKDDEDIEEDEKEEEEYSEEVVY